MNEQPPDLRCDDTGCPKNALRQHQKQTLTDCQSRAGPTRKGPIRGGTLYKSSLECLLSGLCDISLCCILQPVNEQQGGSRWWVWQLVFMWPLSDLWNEMGPLPSAAFLWNLRLITIYEQNKNEMSLCPSAHTVHALNSPLPWNKGKHLSTLRCRLTLLPSQTSPGNPWQNTGGSPMCAPGPGSAPEPWRLAWASGIPRSGAWRGTPPPGPTGASPLSPPLQTATKCRGGGKRSRSWLKAGAPCWAQQSCTCYILLRNNPPSDRGKQFACRSRRARRSWSRTLTGCWELCPEPSCPCAGCRLAQSNRSPDLDH